MHGDAWQVLTEIIWCDQLWHSIHFKDHPHLQTCSSQVLARQVPHSDSHQISHIAKVTALTAPFTAMETMMSSHTSSSRAWWERTLCKRIGFRVRTASGACPPLSRRISTTRARMWASGFLALVTFTMADTSITWSVQGNRSGKGGQGSLLSFVSLSSSPSWSRSAWSSCSKSSLLGACLSLATKWKETSKDEPFDSQPSAEAAKAAAKANPSVGAPSPLSFSKGFVLWVCTFRARGTSPARARLVKLIGSVQVESVLQITPAKFGRPLQYYHVLPHGGIGICTVRQPPTHEGWLEVFWLISEIFLTCISTFSTACFSQSRSHIEKNASKVWRVVRLSWLKHIETREISWWSWRSWSDIVVDGLRWTFPNTPAPSLTPEWRPGLRTLLHNPNRHGSVMAENIWKSSWCPSLSSLVIVFFDLLSISWKSSLPCLSRGLEVWSFLPKHRKVAKSQCTFWMRLDHQTTQFGNGQVIRASVDLEKRTRGRRYSRGPSWRKAHDTDSSLWLFWV